MNFLVSELITLHPTDQEFENIEFDEVFEEIAPVALDLNIQLWVLSHISFSSRTFLTLHSIEPAVLTKIQSKITMPSRKQTIENVLHLVQKSSEDPYALKQNVVDCTSPNYFFIF